MMSTDKITRLLRIFPLPVQRRPLRCPESGRELPPQQVPVLPPSIVQSTLRQLPLLPPQGPANVDSLIFVVRPRGLPFHLFGLLFPDAGVDGFVEAPQEAGGAAEECFGEVVLLGAQAVVERAEGGLRFGGMGKGVGGVVVWGQPAFPACFRHFRCDKGVKTTICRLSYLTAVRASCHFPLSVVNRGDHSQLRHIIFCKSSYRILSLHTINLSLVLVSL